MTQRIAVIGGGVGRREPLGPIEEVRSADFEATLVNPRLKVFPHTPYERGLSIMAYLDSAIEAQKAGFGAVFINTMGDYGIDEMRSALRIPVVGAGEAALTMSATVGRKFSVVKIWPPRMNFITEERLRSTGADARCASIRNVLRDDEVVSTTTAVGAIETMNDHNEDFTQRVHDAVRLAVEEDSADSVVLGCTCMAVIGPEIADRAPVPVIEPMRAGYVATEAMLRLNLTQSRVAYPQANPDLLRATEDMIANMERPNLSADCDMCVVSEAAE
ncbi:MAG: aspartate/glutamate racemase family protein [Alphaproteobacteria bacterium]